MSYAAALPSIRPISDLRTKLPEIETVARETGEPVVMTKNGVPSLAIMDSGAYEERLVRERAVRKLREAEIEARYVSEAVPYDQVKRRVDAIIEAAERAHALR